MTEITFAKLVYVHNNSWHLEDGQLYVKGRSMQHGEFKALATEAMLNAEHPDLFAAIHAMFDWNNYNTGVLKGYVSSYEVLQTLENLKDPVPTFLSTDGKYWRLLEIGNFMVYASDPPQVWLKGARQRIVTVSSQGRQVQFVQGTHYDGWYADIRALDADYPGWEKRYSIGRELGIRVDELFDYCFSQTPAPAVELTPITFE